MLLLQGTVYVMRGSKDKRFNTLDEALTAHSPLVKVFTVRHPTEKYLAHGSYYLELPRECPYSGQPCQGGNCSPCEYVPQ